jgi:enoyl-[acyl-carrier protein] reductase II
MGAASPPALAAAVSEAGGLGMLGTARGFPSVTGLSALLEELRGLTSQPFGVNFILSALTHEKRH